MNDSIIGKIAQKADSLLGRNLKIFSLSSLKKAITSRKISTNPTFWNNGVLSWALNNYSKIYGNSVFDNLNNLSSRSHPIRLVDDALYYYANYDLISTDKRDSVYSFLKTYERDDAGSIMYRSGYSAAFLDTIGMVTPFLFRYGSENSSKEAIKLGMQQFRAFFENGIDDTTQLPYHGYSIAKGEKCGVIGWGRGVGWLLVGLSESLGWLDTGSDEYKEIEMYLRQTLDATMMYLRDDGSFSWQLQAKEGHLDTSVAGMVGYSLEHYNRISGVGIYCDSADLIRTKLEKSINSDGLVMDSSAECRGFSMYPQIYESNSWAQGFSLLFLLESKRQK